MGDFGEIQTVNRKETKGFDAKIYAFTRWSADERLVVVTNFSDTKTSTFNLEIPANILKKWELKDGNYPLLINCTTRVKQYLL